jgi:ADP-heptose:LPS heptosyltransferase
VLIGADADRSSIELIAAVLPKAVNLLNQTTIPALYHLAAGAALAVGNDTGPMHIAALSGAPCVVLYSHASNPARCGQRGAQVRIVRVPDLGHLSVDHVLIESEHHLARRERPPV